ncbi:MerC domain-containing protein [Flavobacteriaceae bacterium]|nr:MerC domain-containing protein [Flavobacteriaceae bacterium]
MILVNQKPDNVGAIASTLCLLHCISTPLIFIAQAGSLSCCSTPPTWWKLIDILFVIISFFAIYNSTLTSSSKLMKASLWFFWFLLFFIILNEKIAWLPINENFIYFPALALTVLHLYNKKHYQSNRY